MSRLLALATIALLAVAALDSIALSFPLGGWRQGVTQRVCGEQACGYQSTYADRANQSLPAIN
jgi:hypothetical protein